MTSDSSSPTLVCYDGSEHSRRSLEAIRGLLAPSEVVVLTVWQPLVTKLAEGGSFGVFALDQESEVDEAEERAARAAAEVPLQLGDTRVELVASPPQVERAIVGELRLRGQRRRRHRAAALLGRRIAAVALLLVHP